jgi:hypothetical protein
VRRSTKNEGHRRFNQGFQSCETGERELPSVQDPFNLNFGNSRRRYFQKLIFIENRTYGSTVVQR